MGKYSKLGVFLQNSTIDPVKLTFNDVENILGFNLPKSARKYQAWWANNGDSHTHAVDGWLAMGWMTKVALDNQVVIFTRREDAEKVKQIDSSSNRDTTPAELEEIAQNSMSKYNTVPLSARKHPNVPKLSNMLSNEHKVTFKAVGELNTIKNVLISCVSQKLEHRAKAKDLYVSTLFRYNLQYAMSMNADRIFILSANTVF
jgi:hypothetical protein